MKSAYCRLITILLVLFTTDLLQAQENEDYETNYQVGFWYGVQTSFKDRGFASGQGYAIQAAYFPYGRTGIRLGFNSYDGFNGVEKYNTFPLYFAYRIESNEPSATPAGTYSENIFEDLIWQCISLLPSSLEFNIGLSPGYFRGDGSQQWVSNDGGATYYSDYFRVRKKFSCSVDASIRATFYIWRFGLSVAPSLSYLLTRNIERVSDIPELAKRNPSRWWGGVSFGASFRF